VIETMEKSSGETLGYKASGDITKADYQTLDPAVEAAIKEYGSVRLLFDLTDFKWEKVSAWGDDLNFGKKYKGSVEKMALVGHAKWEKHAAKVAGPLYAKETKYFENADDAWDWLDS
jgi:hypothetical protein